MSKSPPKEIDSIPVPEEVRRTIERCKEETKIAYPPGGGFFRPRLKGINHLEVGRSKIISNPITILLEWIILQWRRIWNCWRRFLTLLFPRHPEIIGHREDARLVGRTIHSGDRGNGSPIHHLHLEFWGRTWLGGWRKLSQGISDQEGNFALPFDLRQARRLWIRSLQFEIQSTTRVYFDEETPKFHYDLFHKIKVTKSDLIGLDYNLRTIRLDYWLYRENAPTPRASVSDVTADDSEKYSQGRIDALESQVIPIELTKIKHLDQIEIEPGSLSIPEIQSDYPLNLTTCIEKHLPGYTRGDDWFGERMMNGMNRGYFEPDPKEEGKYWIRYFGKCWYDSNEIYAFPAAEIAFRLKKDGLPLPTEIRLTGCLSSHDKDPWKTHLFSPQDGEKWLQAKRVARVSGAFCTEVEEHFAGTHLNTEQYAIAAYRNLRLNPIAGLLLPHLKEVSLIDHGADKLLIRDYIPSATALTEKGLKQRTRDIVGMLDWKGWKPMKPLNEAHTCAHAENLFWEITGKYVDAFIEARAKEIQEHWWEIYRFSEDLVNHAVPIAFSAEGDRPPHDDRWHRLAERRFDYYRKQYGLDTSIERPQIDGETRVISRITSATSFDDAREEDWQNLKDACRYAIMTATFLHTWINEHQYDDLGEILYSSGGLRYGEKPEGIMAPEDDYQIAPDLVRSTQMLWFTNFLSRTEYGFIIRNEEGDVNPLFSRLLEEKREEFKKLHVDIDAIESRTNI